MAENIDAFQAEIKELEARLEAKKREMAASGIEAPEAHIFKTVIKEHSERSVSNAPAELTTTSAAPAIAESIKLTTTDEQLIDKLVEHAFTKGIAAAVVEAGKTQVPFLIDMLHDRLADEYYEKLLESRKLNRE